MSGGQKEKRLPVISDIAQITTRNCRVKYCLARISIRHLLRLIQNSETGMSKKMILYGTTGNPANVVVGWIHKTDGTVSMTTAYIKEV